MEREKPGAVPEEEDLIAYNEQRANHYAAKCLRICALVAVAAWVLDIVGIFIVPLEIMNVGISLCVACMLAPTLLCRLTGGRGWQVKYGVIFFGVAGIFALSCALSKHAILAWALPIMLSCHYYSKKLTLITLVVSQILMGISLYISMYYGDFDQHLLNAGYYEGERIITEKMLYETGLFFVLPRCAILLGLASICITVVGRTHGLLIRQNEIIQERQRIGTELAVATQIQADMLPSIFPAFPERSEFDIYATMAPAREVGGDFYDFFMVDDRHLAVVMADVSGKGVPAALFMVIGKTLIKDHTLPGVDLGTVFSQVNELLCEANKEGLFITAFEGVLNLVTGELRFVNAGHEPTFLCPAGGTYVLQKTRPGFVLAGMEGMTFRADSVTLSPGDRLFQYTDGVTEATRSDQELYGMDRLQAVLDRNRGAPPRDLLAAVKTDIDAFVGEAEQFDDITMLCLEFKQYMSQEERRPGL